MGFQSLLGFPVSGDPKSSEVPKSSWVPKSSGDPKCSWVPKSSRVPKSSEVPKSGKHHDVSLVLPRLPSFHTLVITVWCDRFPLVIVHFTPL